MCGCTCPALPPAAGSAGGRARGGAGRGAGCGAGAWRRAAAPAAVGSVSGRGGIGAKTAGHAGAWDAAAHRCFGPSTTAARCRGRTGGERGRRGPTHACGFCLKTIACASHTPALSAPACAWSIVMALRQQPLLAIRFAPSGSSWALGKRTLRRCERRSAQRWTKGPQVARCGAMQRRAQARCTRRLGWGVRWYAVACSDARWQRWQLRSYFFSPMDMASPGRAGHGVACATAAC
jgi:hypothetical protein